MFPSISFVIGLALTVNIRTSSVSAQNTTSPDEICNPACLLGGTGPEELDEATGGFPGSCSDEGVQGYAQCLDCRSLNNNPGGREISAYQSILNELVDECNSSGYPVKSAKVAGAYKTGPGITSPNAAGSTSVKVLATAGVSLAVLGMLV
ncbi:hypothetical protein B0H13DRAFT_2327535 [Mycena leptocephala]|nr:hypothetical protein B0H13DRAFT_2327535 [Mycena leptocephala]